MLSWFKARPSSADRGLPSHSGDLNRSTSSSATTTTTARRRDDDSDGFDDVPVDSGPRSNGRLSFSAPVASNGSFVGSSASTSSTGVATTSYPPTRATKSIAVTNGYPSLRSTFRKLERVFSNMSPVLYDSLAPAARPNSPELLALLHAISPYYLPSAVLESYLCHDGQDPFSTSRTGLVYGLRWLSLDEVLQEWIIWRKFEAAGGHAGMKDVFSASSAPAAVVNGTRIHPYTVDEADEIDNAGMSSFPPGWVRRKYSHPGWIPLLSDSAGNYIGVDLDPPPPSQAPSSSSDSQRPTTFGQSGQVIAFGREIDEKVVLFPGDSTGGWGRFLAAFVDDVARGEFARLGEGSSSDRSSDKSLDIIDENEEDGIGQQSYFDGDRYGEDGIDAAVGDTAASWTLRSEWRHWIAANDHAGGIIGALAERSRRQWQAVGIGVQERRLKSPFRAPLEIDVPPQSSSSSSNSLKSPPIASSSKETLDGSSGRRRSQSSRNDLTPTRNGTNSVEWTVSPASPARSNRSAVTSPRSPHFLDATRSGKSPRSPGRPQSQQPTRKRGPPPPPVPLDLPTAFDFDSGARATAALYSEGGVDDRSPDEPVFPSAAATSLSARPRSSLTETGYPLASSSSTNDLALLPPNEPMSSLSLTVDDGGDRDIGLERLRTPPPVLRHDAPSDNPYGAGAGAGAGASESAQSKPDLIRLKTGSSSDSRE